MKELYFYKLEYRQEGEKDYILLSEGTKPKKDEVLGHLDTTMLTNGRYELRLWVQDYGGNIVKVTNRIMVDGNLKVGAMNIGFTDITSEIGGTTVNVNRMYNSYNKKSGDFGYGWSLSMHGIELYESNSIAKGYKMSQSGKLFGTSYQLTETISHDVLVNYGDGTSDRFELTFSPEQKALVPITETKVGYTCVTNPKVKLEILADTSAYVTNSSLTFYDEAMYDHLRYKLTTEDGIEVYISTLKGVYQIVDTTGNVIIVDENGYHSENGKSITLVRDEQGRVTSATDVRGNVTTYVYDKDGNLASVTDKAENTVSFTYDDNHNLISIIDPMGVATARNEYDENGRLIATIDADGNRMEYTYDVEGRTQAVKDRRGNTTVYTYDDNGNVLKTVDALGNATYNTYDAHGNVLTRTDANGNTTSYTYDAMDNVTQVQAADGTVVESTYTQENYVSTIRMMDKTVIAMDYDSMGRITEIADANGNATSYEYNSDGRLTSLTDQIGAYQQITYDWDGNVAATTDGVGQKTAYTYDADGNCTRVLITRKDDNGVTRTITKRYSYDEAGNITKSIDNAGNVTTYEYDANGNQTASVDAKGRRMEYHYDDMGNMVEITYPDGTHETFVYDENGNTIQATDRNGLSATMTYDKVDRLIQKTYADGTSESCEYDGAGNLISQTSTSGAKTTYTYNNRNLNTSITDAYGSVTTFEYDEAARLIKTTDNEGNEITYTYDANGNIIKTTYADGSCVTADYDARNRITRQTDQNGNETIYEYDGADRLVKVTDAYGNSYTYGYDGGENLTTITDPLENVTTYGYSNLGQVTSVTNALGKRILNRYSSTGDLVYYTDYAGTTFHYTYDDQDRIVSESTSGIKITYTYTGDNLTKVLFNNDEVNFAYDKYNRLVAKTDAKGNEIIYDYDQYGRIGSITVAGNRTTYEYDLLDRVTRVIDHNGQATVYEYDSLGNRSAVRYPNGTTLTYTYDACQRLKEECLTDANGKQLAKYNYELGKAGERTRITETAEDGTVTEISYKYDKLNRLVKEEIECDGNKLTNEYTYDAASNRTSKETTVKGDVTKIADVAEKVSDGSNIDNGTTTASVSGSSTGTSNASSTSADISNDHASTSSSNNYEVEITEGKTTYAYNDLNQLISETSETGSITYEYDNNGNLIKQTGDKNVTYAYDKKNHLLQATVQKGNAVTIESYTYDYAGNRVSKEVNENGKTYYVIDESSGLAQVAAETDETGTITCSYTLNADERISMERNGKTSYYLCDGHGNVRALVDEEGTITDSYSYDAYGNLLQAEGETKNDFLYTGEQYNATTGLYYLRARYMNPSTGTFISMDSYQGNIYDPISLHKYLYANANSVMNTDPTGYFSVNMSQQMTSIVCTGVLATTMVMSGRMALNIYNKFVSKLNNSLGVFVDIFIPPTVYKDAVLDIPMDRDNTYSLETFPARVITKALFDIIYAIKCVQEIEIFPDLVSYANEPQIDTLEESRTNWGKEHGRGNTKHNNAIEDELDEALEKGATNLAKNKAQTDVYGNRVYSSDGHYVKPDASYTLNGVRYNTNYVSNYKLNNTRSLNDELAAFRRMVEADPNAVNRLVFDY